MGYGASIGTRAAEMALAGFVGIDTELPVVENNLATWVEDRTWWDGGEFAATAGYVKFHSACALSHTVIDAARRIDPDVAASPASVLVEVNANGTKLDRLPRDNRLSRLFSIQHAAASALVDQSFPIRTDATSPEVDAIAPLVTVAEDLALTGLWPEHSAARVTVTSTTGASDVVERLDPDGFGDDAFIDTALVGKFVALTGDWPLAADVWRTWAGEELP
jgi:2-methylcitrate dehydratase PrpD